MYIAMFMVTIKRMFLKVYSEQGSTLHNVGGNINWYNYYEEQYGDSLKKTGNRTAIWPSKPTAEHTHWGNQNWKRHVYSNVHHSTVYNSQDMEAT